MKQSINQSLAGRMLLSMVLMSCHRPVRRTRSSAGMLILDFCMGLIALLLPERILLAWQCNIFKDRVKSVACSRAGSGLSAVLRA
jgi:hypothetical protein